MKGRTRTAAQRKRNSRLHPALVVSEVALKAARSKHRRLVREVQARCKHEVVYHANYEPSRSGLFNAMPAHRMCVRCGFEEEGGITTSALGFKVLRTDITVKVNLMELFSMRVEGSKVPR